MNRPYLNYVERFNRPDSLLLGQGHNYLKSAEEWGVDPFILLGVAMQESAWGTDELALKKNNVGGLRIYDKKYKSYRLVNYNDLPSREQNIARSIDRQAKAVRHQYDNNQTTLEKFCLYGNYTCATSGGREQYLKNVVYCVNTIIDEYNRLLNE